jgi:hypothetical protein
VIAALAAMASSTTDPEAGTKGERAVCSHASKDPLPTERLAALLETSGSSTFGPLASDVRERGYDGVAEVILACMDMGLYEEIEG